MNHLYFRDFFQVSVAVTSGSGFAADMLVASAIGTMLYARFATCALPTAQCTHAQSVPNRIYIK
ncbi:hypothetical protein HNI00_07500 [Thermoleptolyngbya oregonensis NK1-22]|uniref:Uncharacterized protein n=1 Tax=Thermoleptolyngbya oregonensis NK1-22 TaxID=2547457 RepID=A0AA96Y407_9CYAN|nr:hypothetical protein [Thermoleptolyngbya oregonensis]WOB43019.1 hypothetical protein HNI00_07500 [Thermoleptolyngbya oregonensis NK1-22]